MGANNMKIITLLAVVGIVLPGVPLAAPDWDALDRAAAEIQPQVVAWRRWFHQHPELSNREFETAKKVADTLREFGLEPRTGIAHTGVTALIEGGRPGPLIALRADMDALPVTERTGLPFASTARAQYNGQATGVMHACGHDTHMAMLLGAAKILQDRRADLAGSVLLIFQPAEEGAPVGEYGGARLMLDEGLFEPQTPAAVFGIHVGIAAGGGTLATRPGPLMASAEAWTLKVIGRQTHGARPWDGIDPITIAAQIVLAFQTITARQVDVTRAPSIISVGRISGGIRNNVIPDVVELEGTIRAFDPAMRAYIHKAMARTAQGIADSAGARVEFEIDPRGVPAVINDPALTERMWPVLERVAGEKPVERILPQTVGEDFSYYAQATPGLFVFLGSVPDGIDPATAPTNHSPYFTIHEPDMETGVRLYVQFAAEFLH